MEMPGLNKQTGEYRYGFNGKENDREWGAGGLTQDYGFRLYNPGFGRFLSVDPLAPGYPMLTPYQFASNTPIWAIDLDGLEALYTTPDNGLMTLPESSQVTRYQGSQAKGSKTGASYNVTPGSVSSFDYNGSTYKAQFNTETGAFTGYSAPDGTRLSYDTNTLPAASASDADYTNAAATGLFLARLDGPAKYGDIAGLAVGGGMAISAWALSQNIDLLGDVSIYPPGSAPLLPINEIWSPFDIPIDYAVADDGVSTTVDPNDYITVFRGVHPEHPDYPNALLGVAQPWGGHADPDLHNRGDNKSIFTSWTVNPWIANDFATKHGSVSGGVILIKKVHWSEIELSPDIFNQGEVLLRGTVTGATPVPAVKTP